MKIKILIGMLFCVLIVSAHGFSQIAIDFLPPERPYYGSLGNAQQYANCMFADRFERVALGKAALLPKKLYLVPLSENIRAGEEEAYLARFGLRPCKADGLFYLLYAVEQVRRNFPPSLEERYIVALDPENAMKFAEANAPRGYYIAVYSTNMVSCRWNMLAVKIDHRPWLERDHWVFLAEDIPK